LALYPVLLELRIDEGEKNEEDRQWEEVEGS
jgi:hypothetical protein